VQTRGARAAYHGIEDERHARLRALSGRSVSLTGARSRVGVGCLPIVPSVAARAGQVSAPQHKSVPLLIKSADDQGGTFVGLASVFDHLDHDVDIVRRDAFAKSLDSGSPIPLVWMHEADDHAAGSVMSSSHRDRGRPGDQGPV
jgi:hypothetical protein